MQVANKISLKHNRRLKEDKEEIEKQKKKT